jgi:hypothetical protein
MAVPLLPLAALAFFFFAAKSQSSPAPVSAQYFAQVKGAIKTAVDADIGRGAPSAQATDAWLNQLAMAWIRGNAVEVGGIAGGLQATFPMTAQAFGSRYQQITGRAWIPVAAAVAPKAA